MSRNRRCLALTSISPNANKKTATIPDLSPPARGQRMATLVLCLERHGRRSHPRAHLLLVRKHPLEGRYFGPTSLGFSWRQGPDCGHEASGPLSERLGRHDGGRGERGRESG